MASEQLAFKNQKASLVPTDLVRLFKILYTFENIITTHKSLNLHLTQIGPFGFNGTTHTIVVLRPFIQKLDPSTSSPHICVFSYTLSALFGLQ